VALDASLTLYHVVGTLYLLILAYSLCFGEARHGEKVVNANGPLLGDMVYDGSCLVVVFVGSQGLNRDEVPVNRSQQYSTVMRSVCCLLCYGSGGWLNCYCASGAIHDSSESLRFSHRFYVIEICMANLDLLWDIGKTAGDIKYEAHHPCRQSYNTLNSSDETFGVGCNFGSSQERHQRVLTLLRRFTSAILCRSVLDLLA
jgi:hypothetical protein